jgi:hypothetical protein
LNNFADDSEQFHAIWQNGIDTNDYYLKLCGSGGGYILGFTEDLERAKLSLKDYKLEGGTSFNSQKYNLKLKVHQGFALIFKKSTMLSRKQKLLIIRP